MEPIHTERLRLVAATARSTRLEQEDRDAFFEHLGAIRSVDWPPDTLRDVLPSFLAMLEADSRNAGWYAWYWIHDRERTLVGGGGFKGRARADGTVEIGYELCERHRGNGYATEAVRALAAWALRQGGVSRVVAETARGNERSRRVLERVGFRLQGGGPEPGLLCFELQRSPIRSTRGTATTRGT
jgi:RimJ/RimL family protein N-acetyltransferase